MQKENQIAQKAPSTAKNTGPTLSKTAVPQLQIERIIGMSQSGSKGTSSVVDASYLSRASMAFNPKNGDIAYIAGAFIVIYGVKTSKQEKFLKNERGRAFQCLAYSSNGSWFAAGDNMNSKPEISIWEVSEMEKNGRIYNQKFKLSGHRFGIQSIKFSPNNDYLISMGDPNDRGLFVWDFQKQELLTSNKLGKPINAFDFESNQRYFVTAGYSHLKFWYFDELTKKVKQVKAEGSNSQVIESFSVDLSKVKNKIFVGVCCRSNLVYALASDGHIYVYSEERKLSKWMDIKVGRAFGCSLDTINDNLYCACADGVLRVFDLKTLKHVTTFQKPPPLGSTNVETGVKKIKVANTQASKFSDVLAVVVDDQRHRILTIYSENMVFLWDIKDIQKIQVYRTFMAHNGPIHGIQKIDPSHKIGLKESDEGLVLRQEDALTRFVTCASDRTLRFWHFADASSIQPKKRQDIQKGLSRNAYCKDMSKIIFVNNSEDVINQNYDVLKAKPVDRNDEGQELTKMSQNSEVLSDILIRRNLDIEQNIRCFCMSHDGRHVACGDWYGNIRIYNLEDPDLSEVKCIEAHENEVLSIDFTYQIIKENQNLKLSEVEDENPGYLLASGSRDRLIQIYDSKTDYDITQILAEHSSAVTSVKFLQERMLQSKKDSVTPKDRQQISLISGGADQQMMKHVYLEGKINDLEPFKQVISKNVRNKIFSMEIARNLNDNNSLILTGLDKNLSMRDTLNFDVVWEKHPDPKLKVKPDQMKVFLDENGEVAVSSNTAKQLTIFEAKTGKVLCKATCGELITGMCFSENGKHLITTSSTGVIYIWSLIPSVVKALQSKRSDDIISLQQLEQITEEDMEESLKRMSSNKDPVKGTNQPQDLIVQPEFDKSAQVKSELDGIFANIGKVNGMLNQIDQEKVDSPKKSPKKTDQSQLQLGSDISTRQDQSLHFGANSQHNLPRWAQSVISPLDPPKPDADKTGHNESSDMSQIFEQNLKRLDSQVLDKNIQQDDPSETSKKITIDLLDGCDDEEEFAQPGTNRAWDNDGEKDQKQLDEEEKSIIQNIRNKKFENLYGLVGEESALSSNLRKSRDTISKKSISGGLRKSVTSKFFMRADSDSVFSGQKTPEIFKKPTFDSDYKPKLLPSTEDSQKVQKPDNVLKVSDLLKNKDDEPKLIPQKLNEEKAAIKAQDFKESVLDVGPPPPKKQPKTDRPIASPPKLENIQIETISNDRSNLNLDEISIQLTDKDFDGNKSKNETTLQIEHAASGKVNQTPEITSAKVPSFSEASVAAPQNLFTPAFKQPESVYKESSAKVQEFKEESKQNMSQPIKESKTTNEPKKQIQDIKKHDQNQKQPVIASQVFETQTQQKQEILNQQKNETIISQSVNVPFQRQQESRPPSSTGSLGNFLQNVPSQVYSSDQRPSATQNNTALQSMQFYDSHDTTKLIIPQSQDQISSMSGVRISESQRSFVPLNNSVQKSQSQRINDSLKNITQILQNQNQATQQSQSDLSQISVSLKDPSKPPCLPKESLGETQQSISLDPNVQEQLSQSIGLWNTMMLQMKNQTSIDLNKIEEKGQSYTQSSQPQFASNVQDSVSNQSVPQSRANPYFSTGQYMSTASNPYLQTQSQFSGSQTSLTSREDVQDLLDKFSDILLEKMAKKGQ